MVFGLMEKNAPSTTPPHACPAGKTPTHVEVFTCTTDADGSKNQNQNQWSVMTCSDKASSEAKASAEAIQSAFVGSGKASCVSNKVMPIDKGEDSSLGSAYSTTDRMIDALSKKADRHMRHSGFARSCAPDFNPNNVSNWNQWTCRYLGTGMTDKGVLSEPDPHRTWSGKLASCEDEIGISDDLMRDIQHAAYMKASGEEAGLDPSKFRCSVMSVPQLG